MKNIKLKKKRSKKRTNITVTDNPRSCDFWNKNKQGLNKAGEVAALFFAARYKNRVWQRRWPVVTEQRGKEGGRQSSSQWLVAKNEERNWKKEDGSWCSLGLGHPLSSNEASSFFRRTNQPTNHSTTLTTLHWGSLGLGTELIKNNWLLGLVRIVCSEKNPH